MTRLIASACLISLGIFFQALQPSGSMLSCKQSTLVWHNYYRRIHQVKNVTWSQRLWTQANKWAEYLARNNKFHHESKNPGNLFLSPGQPADPCARAVKLFYLEEKYYNYKKPQYYRAAGHFTQLVWKNTKQIGAVSKRRRDGKTVVVIKYNPPGNFLGHFAENVFPPRKVDTITRPFKVTVSDNNGTSTNSTVSEKPSLRVYVIAEAATVHFRGMQFALLWLLTGILA